MSDYFMSPKNGRLCTEWATIPTLFIWWGCKQPHIKADSQRLNLIASVSFQIKCAAVQSQNKKYVTAQIVSDCTVDITQFNSADVTLFNQVWFKDFHQDQLVNLQQQFKNPYRFIGFNM